MDEDSQQPPESPRAVPPTSPSPTPVAQPPSGQTDSQPPSSPSTPGPHIPSNSPFEHVTGTKNHPQIGFNRSEDSFSNSIAPTSPIQTSLPAATIPPAGILPTNNNLTPPPITPILQPQPIMVSAAGGSITTGIAASAMQAQEQPQPLLISSSSSSVVSSQIPTEPTSLVMPPAIASQNMVQTTPTRPDSQGKCKL